jgi:hypothetical protein
MHALVAEYKTKETITALKKANSVLGQAFSLAQSEYGNLDGWYDAASDANPSAAVARVLSDYVKALKVCSASDTSKDCLKNNKYIALHGGTFFVGNQLNLSSLVLPDGMFFIVNTDFTDHAGGGWVVVDVNGARKPPNQIGVDSFLIRYRNNGTVDPLGTAASGMEAFADSCRDKASHIGYACAAWVIQNENLDYLHCNDLSWDGKYRCD